MNEPGQQAAAHAPQRVEVQDFASDEEVRPPLPPRPSFHKPPQSTLHSLGSGLKLQKSSRPQLQATATTALSLTDIHTQSFQDGSRETFAEQAEPASSGRFLKGPGSIRRSKGHNGSDTADSGSVRSYAPTLEAGGDIESLLGEVLGASPETPAWRLPGTYVEDSDIFGSLDYEDDDSISGFDNEFDELDELSTNADNEGEHYRTIALHITKDSL